MDKYITVLDVSINAEEEQDLQKSGFSKINVNLNTGAGGNNTFLWYKRGNKFPITRVQVTFNQEMETGLTRASYTKIDKDLNSGTTGGPLYMWYSRAIGCHDVPIVDIIVTKDPQSEANHLTAGGVWEEVSCNLNLGTGGDYVYIWMRREQPIYICEVTATNTYDSDAKLFTSGYTRVDVNTNMGAVGGSDVFIWYRKTTDITQSLSDLQISTNHQQYKQLQGEGFEVVDINLNENTSGNAVYLWNKKEPGVKNIRAMVLLLNKNAVRTYAHAGIKVIYRSLNIGNRGATIYLCLVWSSSFRQSYL